MNLETSILIIAYFVAVALGVIIIPILRKLKVGQIERDDGPQSHLKKQGTPTMGGIIMIITMILVVTAVFMFVDGFRRKLVKSGGHGRDEQAGSGYIE